MKSFGLARIIKRNLLVLFLFAAVVCAQTSPAQAACTGPAGNGGDLTYDSAARKMAYCNTTAWVQIGAGPNGGGGCTNPVGIGGAIIFDSSNRVMKHCNGQEWATWGVVGGISSGSGCTSPTGIGGALLYNSDFRVLQYCDGKTWEMVGGYQPTMVADFAAGIYRINGTTYGSYAAFKTAISLSFTRASTATYYNSAGVLSTAASGVERFDYDPLTLDPKGFLIEEARTNITLQSGAIDNGSWAKANVTVTANTTVAPDGTTTAETVSASNTTGAYFVQNPTFAANTILTRSIYAKAGTANIIAFEQSVAGVITYTTFNLSTATVTGTGTGTTATIQEVGKGWYRLTATRTFTVANDANNKFGVIYVGDPLAPVVGATVFLWGAQTEVGPDASSYIPTTAASVTRDQELVTFAPGTWYDATRGTFFAEAYAGMESTDPVNTLYYYGTILGMAASVNGDKAWLGFAAAPNISDSWPGINESQLTFSPATSRDVSMRQAVTWTDTTNLYTMAANGTLLGSPVSYATKDWTITTFALGSGAGGGFYYLDGSVRQLVYYPFRVPDTVLQTMTQRSTSP